MTKDEFESLEPGDIVSHAIRPWTTFIITYCDVTAGKTTFFACKQGLSCDVISITNGVDWFLISKVTQRRR